MPVKNVCKYEKYGHCKQKKDCKDHHPTEVCKEPVCNVAKCSKRHPQPCRYYKAGSCRFKEYCKYDHQEQINAKELLEKIRNLETEKSKILEMYENLNKRLNHLEKNNQRNVEDEEETNVHEDMKMDEDTLVFDDQNKKSKESKKRKLPTDDEDSSSQKNVTTNKITNLQKEVEVFTETLETLKIMKSKIKTSKKEHLISDLKKIIDNKKKALGNNCSVSTNYLIEEFEETLKKWKTCEMKTFIVNAERDLKKMTRDVIEQINLKTMEKNHLDNMKMA